MLHSQFTLLADRRFAPLFMTQLLGAFNDNVYKNALIILTTYVLASHVTSEINYYLGLNFQSSQVISMLVALCNMVFVIPMVMFSACAGQLADKYEKSRLVRKIKLAEIFIMAFACVALFLKSYWLLLVILFFMGTQSTFFGPLKYSILPQHLEKDELIGGNALIEAATFISILCGNLLGAVFILQSNGSFLVAGIVVGIAVLGYVFSFFIPRADSVEPNTAVEFNVIKSSYHVGSYCLHHRDILLPILGISWFWLLGSMFVSIFPPFCKEILFANEQVIVIFFVCFSVGIGIGSLMCNFILRGEIKASLVPWGLLGIALFSSDLAYLGYKINSIMPPSFDLQTPAEFVSNPMNVRILFDLTMVAICGGIYIVPVYAMMQDRSDPGHRARVVACNNIFNSLFMLGSSCIIIAMTAIGFNAMDLFLAITIANLFLAAYFLLTHSQRMQNKLNSFLL